ncbi:hypothetical protein Glove_132g199 [Diversispora epigaea]|uniref:Uncharacterized protein n=1 Tax=Diversispora epigaea TaxID=1348612 RepID=A0A397IXM4_9GLOM|nr:hypothetical protein Glove_132g199 [Diversispora epigaea]
MLQTNNGSRFLVLDVNFHIVLYSNSCVELRNLSNANEKKCLFELLNDIDADDGCDDAKDDNNNDGNDNNDNDYMDVNFLYNENTLTVLANASTCPTTTQHNDDDNEFNRSRIGRL